MNIHTAVNSTLKTKITMKKNLKMIKNLMLLFLVVLTQQAIANCPINAIKYEAGIKMKQGEKYCIEEDITLNGIAIPKGALLQINPNVKVDIKGNIDIQGRLELKESASVLLTGSIIQGSGNGNNSSRITLNKASYISMTGSLTNYGGSLEMHDFAMFEMCGTFSNHRANPYITYIGTKDYPSYFITKAAASGLGSNRLTESSDIIWLAVGQVANMLPGKAKYCENASSSNCSFWPLGLEEGANSCHKLEFVFEETPLPIKLAHFSVENIGNNAILNWQTANEENNKGFAIQKSIDGKSWDEISFVSSKAPSGNSKEVLYYEYIDQNPNNGVNYYRLLQKDWDGSESYSSVQKLLFNSLGFNEWKAYPNPAKDVLILEGINNINYLEIVNTLGRLIHTEKIEGKDKLKIQLNNLPKGMYILRLVKETNDTETWRFLVQ